jgi:hypothetical protein
MLLKKKTPGSLGPQGLNFYLYTTEAYHTTFDLSQAVSQLFKYLRRTHFQLYFFANNVRVAHGYIQQASANCNSSNFLFKNISKVF